MSYFIYNGKKVYYEEHGSGEALVLLHGNTVSGKFFAPVIPVLSEKYHVFVPDFLGCGQSERIDEWPSDLWYEWSKQAAALCDALKLTKVKLIGCSGGALAAINAALERPDIIDCVVADSFEGICADAAITEQIRSGRSYAKQIEDFRLMQEQMHGEDWETVFDADTETVVRHAKEVTDFFHRPLSMLQPKLLLTGSAEDEMFPSGHYEALFSEISHDVKDCTVHIFEHGSHPALISNIGEYVRLFEEVMLCTG